MYWHRRHFFHNRMRDHILEPLRVFLRQHPDLGEVTSETDFDLAPGTIRRPDVALISAAKLKSIDPLKPLALAPDLAIEIASPHDDLPRKIQDYLAAGTRVWALYAESSVAHIHKPGGQPPRVRVAETGDRLEDAELLPGFSCPLADILA